MEEQAALKSLAALAQEARLRIFRVLVVAGEEGMTPGALGDALGLAATTLSFHLKELNRAGLLTQARAGRNLIYRADYVQMNALLAYLTENCCRGMPCIEAATTTTTCSNC